MLMFILKKTYFHRSLHYTYYDSKRREALGWLQFQMSTDTVINDVLLTNGWYRIISSIGDDMPTDPPDSLKCGTWFPIWLNGSLPVPCPYAHSSETGFYPDCTKKNVTSVEVLVDLVLGPPITTYFDGSLVTAFMCKFKEVLRDGGGEFMYDVHWFINEESVILHTGISFNNISSTNLIESDWIGIIHLTWL
ncbi:unnamed protein product [Mytilus edulis]|uniref:Uncharacterized protein n=1 Tax=Mytilus edulis TaxID=6550 RepID=A0A8S3T649_MYTED|nr:unnamed protein product [Mytilus edulis]